MPFTAATSTRSQQTLIYEGSSCEIQSRPGSELARLKKNKFNLMQKLTFTLRQPVGRRKTLFHCRHRETFYKIKDSLILWAEKSFILSAKIRLYFLYLLTFRDDKRPPLCLVLSLSLSRSLQLTQCPILASPCERQSRKWINYQVFGSRNSCHLQPVEFAQNPSSLVLSSHDGSWSAV